MQSERDVTLLTWRSSDINIDIEQFFIESITWLYIIFDTSLPNLTKAQSMKNNYEKNYKNYGDDLKALCLLLYTHLFIAGGF